MLGLWIAHFTVTKLYLEKRLSKDVSQYLNSAFHLHAFNPVHAATHEAISQGSEEHYKFESTVYRLAAPLCDYDDQYKVISHGLTPIPLMSLYPSLPPSIHPLPPMSIPYGDCAWSTFSLTLAI